MSGISHSVSGKTPGSLAIRVMLDEIAHVPPIRRPGNEIVVELAGQAVREIWMGQLNAIIRLGDNHLRAQARPFHHPANLAGCRGSSTAAKEGVMCHQTHTVHGQEKVIHNIGALEL